MANMVDIHGKPIGEKNPLVDKDGNTIINTIPIGQVHGVQVWEKGICVGTALYSTMSAARHVKDILNRKYAELKVEHEAKIILYPVY